MSSFKQENRIGSIDFNLIVGHIFGVPLFLRGTSQLSRHLIIFYSFIYLCLFNILYVYFEIVDLFFIKANINAITQNCCLTLTHLSGNIKFFNIMFRLKDVTTVLEKIRFLPTAYVINDNHKRVFNRSEIENKLIVTAYFTLVMSTGLLGFITLLRDATIGGRLFPYRALLPEWLPQEVRVIYWSCGIIILAIQIVSIDCLNINLVNQIRCHLKLLNLNLDELTTKRKSQKESYEQLKSCVKYHQIILRLRNDVEKIFNIPILVQFMVSLLVFVMTGFQAIVLTGSDGALLTYFYCGCITCQLFSYCWFANQVMEENKLLAIVGYNTLWYEFGERYSKVLLIFMLNAQRPFTFTVGGFFDLSLNTFSGLLSRSYSYVAVLRQVYSK